MWRSFSSWTLLEIQWLHNWEWFLQEPGDHSKFLLKFLLYIILSLNLVFSGATTFTYFLFKYFRIYKLILSQFLVLKCCSAVQVHCSTMPFPPWFKLFVSSSIGGTTQFLFEKADNFVTIFAPIFLWSCLFQKLKNWSIACYRVLLA